MTRAKWAFTLAAVAVLAADAEAGCRGRGFRRAVFRGHTCGAARPVATTGCSTPATAYVPQQAAVPAGYAVPQFVPTGGGCPTCPGR